MRPTDDIEKIVKNITIKSDPEVNKAVLDDLIGQLDTADGAKDPNLKPNIWRTIMKHRITKLTTTAAAALIIFVIIINLSFSPKVSFADIIKPIFEAETFAFDIIFGGEDGPAIHDRVNGNRIRRTTNVPGIEMVIDADAGKLLRLDTKGKNASLVDISGPIKEHARDYISLVRETIERYVADPDLEPKEIHQREVDGQKAIGFSLGTEVTILADAKTGELLQIEIYGGHILKNIEFNIPISEEETSLDPPAGYTMRQTKMDFSKLSEKDLIEGLRIWAKYLRDGTFPPELNKRAYVEQISLLKEKIGSLSITDVEKEQAVRYFMQSMMFLQKVHFGQTDWHYSGQDIQLGDADTAIFWYMPEGSDKYRVIYGDLNVREVASENLPK